MVATKFPQRETAVARSVPPSIPEPPMPSTTRMRILGMLISLGFFASSALLFWVGAADHLDNHDRETRGVVCAFALMMACFSISGFFRAIWFRVRSTRIIAAIFFCMAFLMFAVAFILIGLFRRYRISGGIEFLPTTMNQLIGGVIFILIGLTVIGFLPMMYRYIRDQE
jgi:hypothetical protein